mgnify:CR=1 FL=1
MGNKKSLWLRLLVTAVALCLVIAGCGREADTGSSDASPDESTPAEEASTAPEEPLEPLELTVFISDPGYQNPPADNPIYQMIADEFGITFKWDLLVGDKDQKIGVMIAGGDYPDITTVDTYSNPKFMEAGALLPLDDLITQENAPNLYDHYKDVWNICKNPDDGKFYVMANYGITQGDYQTMTWEGVGFWIQKAVLEDAGYPPLPTTLDEYFGLIEAYMEKNPTIDGQPTIGFEILCEGWRDFCLKHPPEHLMGYPNDGDCIDVDGVATMFSNSPDAKAYYQKLNEEMLKGVIDPEFFSLTYDDYMAKLSQGRVLGMFDQHWDFSNAELNLRNANQDERTWVPCELTLPGYTPHYQDLPVVNVNTGFAITTSCQNPERVVQMFDGMMTEEWQKILGWGLEGKDYSVDSSGRFFLTQEQADQNNDTAYRLANRAYEIWFYGPKIEGTYSDGNAGSPGFQPEVFYESLHQYDKDFLAKYDNMCWSDFLTPAPPNKVTYPLWQIAIPDASDASMAKAKWEETGTKYLPRAILADAGQFDGIWDEYMSELNAIDIQAYTDVVTEQLAWREANWSPDAN